MSTPIAPRCAICGTDLDARVRMCRRCDTQYHSDCWNYNDGCAIYGCRRVARRAGSGNRAGSGKMKGGEVTGPESRLRGALLGFLCGVGVISAFLHANGEAGQRLECLFFIGCAALVGAVSGALLRHRHDGWRIALLGLFGPGTAACVIGLFSGSGSGGLERWVLAMPIVVFYGLVASPLAVPCAILGARYNDPELATPRRQWGWLAAGLVLAPVLFFTLAARWRM